MDKATKGGLAVGALLLAMLLGNALTGMTVIGYHPECIDQDDNDQDGFVDGMDPECSEYPYADGNGEDFTPMEERSTGDSYQSFFEYHRDYMEPMSQPQIDTICFNIVTGEYNDDDGEQANSWATENNVNCESGGP
jgi:hypothetical protein